MCYVRYCEALSVAEGMLARRKSRNRRYSGVHNGQAGLGSRVVRTVRGEAAVAEEMRKRIVICVDGTWNDPEDDNPTNVLRVARAIRP